MLSPSCALAQEWTTPQPSKRPDVQPEFEKLETPLPKRMPGDPEQPDEEEEEEREKKKREQPDEDDPDKEARCAPLVCWSLHCEDEQPPEKTGPCRRKRRRAFQTQKRRRALLRRRSPSRSSSCSQCAH